MIEQYLQFAIQFIAEIWLQLNTMFGLEETRVFKFLKPYLLQVQDNPTYMGIAIALMALLPYSLYKIISIPRKRRKKLNERENKFNELDKSLTVYLYSQICQLTVNFLNDNCSNNFHSGDYFNFIVGMTDFYKIVVTEEQIEIQEFCNLPKVDSLTSTHLTENLSNYIDIGFSNKWKIEMVKL